MSAREGGRPTDVYRLGADATGAEAARSYFDRVAPEWNRLRSGYFGEDVRQEALRRVAPRAHMEVADVGSGTGFLAEGLAPRVAKVHCIDVSTGEDVSVECCGQSCRADKPDGSRASVGIFVASAARSLARS